MDEKLQWRVQIVFSSCNPVSTNVQTQLVPTVDLIRNFMVENKAKMGKNGQHPYMIVLEGQKILSYIQKLTKNPINFPHELKFCPDANSLHRNCETVKTKVSSVSSVPKWMLFY